mmetsp:Transcript_1390/g.2529  ORF Transcript_1390/g.2529 Transcript_1390/m.2529 type:complete len:397 (+) Transcript_1390:32-1222(+)|eukprot:CAMPEP_0176486208 /NCGR_PEP_ID=MMETSP0200_2-20121128/5445_1 /TAXON_ID=947934 /ORGANISM="Chaetoceros sp., Strain GSL56" /LENGTH=396 /DNA_ID=CAMNT_0017882893 /DNA_START=939 /DNA_END=2129 /DNA_ORIENTATION=+
MAETNTAPTSHSSSHKDTNNSSTCNTTTNATTNATTSYSYSISHPYTCITCLEPNQLLYRQYSNARNIKLQTCPQCQRDVDPYIERELLLVIMDMILLRRSAYRHLFLNRWYRYCCRQRRIVTDSDSSSERSKSGDGWNDKILGEFFFFVKQQRHRHDPPMGLLVLLVGVTCMALQMGLKLYHDNDDCNHGDHIDGYCTLPPRIYLNYYPHVLSCIGEMIVLWFGTVASAKIQSNQSKKNYLKDNMLKIARLLDGTIMKEEEEEEQDGSSYFWNPQLFLAIFLPQLFHFVTLFVHIYESSYMVRILGKTFVFCFGYMAVGTVLEKRNIVRVSMMRKKMDVKDDLHKVPVPSESDERNRLLLVGHGGHGLPFVVGSLLETMLSHYYYTLVGSRCKIE